MYWPQPGEAQVMGIPHVTADRGFASRDELVPRLPPSAAGRDVAAADFYLVLAYTKLAVIAEGISEARTHGQGPDAGPLGHARHDSARAARAIMIADASSDRRLRG